MFCLHYIKNKNFVKVRFRGANFYISPDFIDRANKKMCENKLIFILSE